MHETAIVGGLMRILEQKATRHGVARISRVLLKVGRLCAVEPQQLIACFEMFAEGTVADGAELVIDVIGVRGRCRQCAHAFDVPRYRFECPACGGNDIEVIQGQELYIESFEAVSREADATVE
ncbi:MAG: hydrogenase nickel incorporation protein HypA/HybF [Comamonadaceae bacterium]|nr:MAG: hydrogenase nickel incorporation protein HypA/HybF [Comamonadaceae bacterium]